MPLNSEEKKELHKLLELYNLLPESMDIRGMEDHKLAEVINREFLLHRALGEISKDRNKKIENINLIEFLIMAGADVTRTTFINHAFLTPLDMAIQLKSHPDIPGIPGIIAAINDATNGEQTEECEEIIVEADTDYSSFYESDTAIKGLEKKLEVVRGKIELVEKYIENSSEIYKDLLKKGSNHKVMIATHYAQIQQAENKDIFLLSKCVVETDEEKQHRFKGRLHKQDVILTLEDQQQVRHTISDNITALKERYGVDEYTISLMKENRKVKEKFYFNKNNIDGDNIGIQDAKLIKSSLEETFEFLLLRFKEIKSECEIVSDKIDKKQNSAIIEATARPVNSAILLSKLSL